MGCMLLRSCTCFVNRSTSTIYDYDSSSVRSDIEIPSVQVAKPAPKKSKSRLKFGFINSHCLRRLFACTQTEANMTKLEKTVKATLLIQRWFRRYMARLELRRRYTWNIFQSLEYAGEQDQVKLYNFFNALLTHMPDSNTRQNGSTATSRASSIEDFDMLFEDESENDDELALEEKDRHFKLVFPLTEESVKNLMNIYKTKRHYRLHAKHVADIFKHSITMLKKLHNFNYASTGISKQITVCGDLHGKFDDLLVIFHKNGLPSSDNPYVFNGDFVDRGRRGIEVLLVLLCFQILYPNAVYLNRGNHEDLIMNSRYGFIKEVQLKYRKNSEKLLKLIEGVYRWLPLGTIINNKVLVVHGGISDTTDLDLLMSLDRGKYVSLLRPPMSENTALSTDLIDKVEWKQVFDILWSDPQTANGCVPNGLRGAGTYFGPDVTKSFLEKNRMMLIIRSHECKVDGYELVHDNKVITIFSASNYYEIGSNKGAYLRLLGPDLSTHFVQYTSPVGRAKSLTFHQKIGVIESSAVREIHGQIMNNKARLEKEFQKMDPEMTGFISISDWCRAMETATGLELPWRMLRDKLVTLDAETQMIKYNTTFENVECRRFNSVQGTSTVLETLYKNKCSLETIFRIIDKDNSGFITLEEFTEACNIIKEHMPYSLTHDQLVDICQLMDLNKDGLVDLNEFLESFRMADLECSKAEIAQIKDPEVSKPACGSNGIEKSTSNVTRSNSNENKRQNKLENEEKNGKSSTNNITKVIIEEPTSKMGPKSELCTTSDANHSSNNKPTSNNKPIPKNLGFVLDSSTPLNQSAKSLCQINLQINNESANVPKSKSATNFTKYEVTDGENLSISYQNVLNKSPVLSLRRGSQM